MDISSWFFGAWTSILKTVIVGTIGYISLIVLLRISGKRTLSKMNMFDWVVTVAMGSVMATLLLSDGVSYAQGMAAFITLILGQWVVTTLSVKSDAFAKLVKADPTILYYRGLYFKKAMRQERVPKEEILSAIRQSGQGSPEEIEAVILESSGELIVMNKVKGDQTTTLVQAGNWEEVKGV